MIRRRAFIALCALVTILSVRAQGKEPLRSEETPTQTESARDDVQIAVSAASPAIREKTLKVRVTISNATDRYMYLTYNPSAWIRGYSYFVKGTTTGFVVTSSRGHGVSPGAEICHHPDEVHVVKPGGELVRYARVPVQDAPQGRVELTLSIELIRVTPGMTCEKAHLYRRDAKTEIVVQRTARRPTSPKS